jgi:hypothetical protein
LLCTANAALEKQVGERWRAAIGANLFRRIAVGRVSNDPGQGVRMSRAILGVTAGIAVAFAIVGAALSRPNATPTLSGTDGPGFTITLKHSGTSVKTLKAGTYKFAISDKSNFHGFSLDGPHGFAKDFTKIPFVGTKTFVVKLRAGKYKYYCPNHESTMFAHFTVK